MEQEKVPAVNVKEYKKQGKTEAVAYIKRKRKSKGEERKAVVSEQKQKIKDWKRV